MIDPCFIHCHIVYEKIHFIALKQLQTSFWVVDALLFLIDCEKIVQMFKCSYKMMNTLPSDIFKVLTISRNFNLRSAKTIWWTFFFVFRNNYQFWTIREFSVIGVCTVAFKISKPLLYHFSLWSRVQVTLVKTLLCLNDTFSHYTEKIIRYLYS